MRSHCGLISRFFFVFNTFLSLPYPRTVLDLAIHGQDDSLVRWLKEVFSHVMMSTSLPRSILGRYSYFYDENHCVELQF